MEPQRGQSDSFDFEKAVEQVEKIIDRIESGEVGLEKSIAEYERGVGLLKRCREALARAEQRVEELTLQMQADTGAGAKEGGRQGGRATEERGSGAGGAGADPLESPF